MFKRFLPKEVGFFDYFDKHIKITIEACNELLLLSQNPNDLIAKILRIKELEHSADNVTHSCIEALHKTFITPIERTEIHNLIKGLDDVVDSIDSAASRIALYDLKEMRQEIKELAMVLIKSTNEIAKALNNIRDMSDEQQMKDICVRVHNLENEGDVIFRSALVRLFKDFEKEPIMVIKWKEIYERLEQATDHCEDVANIIEGIVLEST